MTELDTPELLERAAAAYERGDLDLSLNLSSRAATNIRNQLDWKHRGITEEALAAYNATCIWYGASRQPWEVAA